MTNTTDTAALRVEIAELRLKIAKGYDGFIPETQIHIKLLERILDQLEAERQRADANAQEIKKLEFQWEYRAPTQWAYDQACTALHAQRERAEKAELELIKPLPIGELIQRLEGQTYEKWFSLSDLKGEHLPVGWVKSSPNEAVSWDSVDPIYLAGSNAPVRWRSDYKPVYDRPQKPVISKEKLCDWLEDNFDIDESQRDAFAQCFAHHCNCIVKEGE